MGSSQIKGATSGQRLAGYCGKDAPKVLPCDTGCRGEGREIGPSMGTDLPARPRAGAAVAPEIHAKQGSFSPELV